jgi:hypothetical protein
MERTLRSFGPLGIAATLALIPVSGSADAIDQPYLVTTSNQSANGTSTSQEVVIVHGATVTADNTGTRDDGRTCLAIVQNVLAAGRKRYTIGVALDDDHAFSVPMRSNVSQPATGARLLQASGDASGDVVSATDRVSIAVHVDARVLAQDGQLQAATLRELTYLITPMQTVQVSACAMQRLPASTPATSAPTSRTPATPTPTSVDPILSPV